MAKAGRPSKDAIARRESDKALRESLYRQLESRKADTPYFRELVDEVMYQRDQLRKLKKIIENDGIIITEQDRIGNQRVSITYTLREIRETEKAILSILKELKITTDNIISDDEDDEL